jgi:predicted transcriptional regulator
MPVDKKYIEEKILAFLANQERHQKEILAHININEGTARYILKLMRKAGKIVFEEKSGVETANRYYYRLPLPKDTALFLERGETKLRRSSRVIVGEMAKIKDLDKKLKAQAKLIHDDRTRAIRRVGVRIGANEIYEG